MATSDPIAMDDGFFGHMVWDETTDWYETHMEFRPGRQLPVHLCIDHSQLPGCIERLRGAYQGLTLREAFLRRSAAESLLDLHNETWNDGEKIGVDQFLDRMTLESVTIESDGSCELWYEDGDLFCGHAIQVSVDSDLKFTDAGIAG